ncbi:hypothetical protein SGADD02_02219 [Streptococcus gallolyticus]|uniref:Gram-positive cocci surface proteins LPxTG domain-containing protein n=1 Tax=Streptococcus gallolyticus TaxID=315405 RepID=A0A139MHX6_9STRE|nr:hypothetical protein SGADD02_02219 [Streptococcus gallolyticus]
MEEFFNSDGSGLRTTFYDNSGAVLGVYSTEPASYPSSEFTPTQISLNGIIPNGAVSAKIELVSYASVPFRHTYYIRTEWSNVQFFYNYYIPVEPIISTSDEETITPPSVLQPDIPNSFPTACIYSTVQSTSKIDTYEDLEISGRIQTVNHYLPAAGDGDNNGLTIIGVGIILFLIIFIYNPKKDS